MRVLVTGGAGFIGSHLVDALINDGHDVTILDNLEPIVHGPERKKPSYLNKKADFIFGDLLDKETTFKAIQNQEIIFHLGGAVGLGLSMYEISKFAAANSVGTANLMEAVLANKNTVKKVIVASSTAVYGEGVYRCSVHGTVCPGLRKLQQLQNKQWEPKCPQCRKNMNPLPTPEDKPLQPNSIYGLTKLDQERMCMIIGEFYCIPVVSLRYFGVYGSRQALSNPYAGIIAIFVSRILNNEPPIIYEDGLQMRDYIHVSDVVRANIMAMNSPEADFQTFNVSSGKPLSLIKMVKILEKKLNTNVGIRIDGIFRMGDSRHAFADVSRINQLLGFETKTEFADGVQDIIDWIKTLDKNETLAFIARFKEQKEIADQKGINI